MVTSTDLLLIDAYTGGFAMPTPAQAAANNVARAYADANGNINLEYVDPAEVFDARSVTAFGAKGDGVTDDTAAINSALANGTHVYFPPGTYKVASQVLGSVADQFVRMAPGAQFLVVPGASNGILFSGARQRLSNLRALISATSSATFSAITIAGASSRADGVRVDVTADVQNATLVRVANDDVRVSDVFLKADSRFLRGVSITKTDDSITQRCVVDGIDTDINPLTSKQLESILDSNGSYAVVRDLEVTTGTNVTFSKGVVRMRTSNLTLDNPQIFCTGAQYGVYGEDHSGSVTSEKLTILQGNIQGRNNATFVSGSEGLRVGHQCGHQKIYGTFINGWENGVVFHGSADNPGFYGAIIANNQNYGFVIDAGLGVGRVRGLLITDCYMQDVNQKYFMHCKSGGLQGCHVTACELGYDDVGILVDSTFDTLAGMVLEANFIQGGSHSVTPLGIIQPNVNTETVLFINNTLQGGNTLGYGTYASKAVDIFDPTLTGVKIGTNGTHITREWSVTASLTYPTALNAGQYEDKTATVTGVAVGDDVRVSVPDDVVYPGDMYFAWVAGANLVKVRRMANGDFPAATSGTFRFTVTKFN